MPSRGAAGDCSARTGTGPPACDGSGIVVNGRFLTQSLTGVQRYAAELTLQLRSLAPALQVVTPRNILHHSLAEELGARVVGRRSGHVWEQFELPAHLRTANARLLLNLANSAPLRAPRQIVTIHDLAFLVEPRWYAWTFRTFYRFLIPRLVRRSAKVVTVSEFTRGELRRLLAVEEDRVAVVPNAVPRAFREIGARPAAETPYILSVATLEPRKNLERLVEAFAGLVDPHLRLVIVGTAHRNFGRTDLQARVAADPRIELRGYLSDSELTELYRSAMLFVYPSLYEGFGIPPLEAMACGCPCLVSSAAALPEVCAGAAAYFDPERSDELSRRMESLVRDGEERARLRELGLARVREFSWERSARALWRVIEEVTAR